MITVTALVYVLIIGLILYLIYFIAGKFVQGTPLQIIGIVLLLIFILYLLRVFGIV